MLSYHECRRLVESARDKRSKPVANNTRVERRGENAYALRLHATDIATYHEDGRITVNSGGWRTVTTAQRLGQFVTRHVFSERGTWYMDLEPNPSDPEPIRGERHIPKPFHALDPGDEPVRDDSDPAHVAGRVLVEPYEEEVLVSKRDIESGRWDSASIIREHGGGGDYFVGYAIQRGFDITQYGENGWGQVDHELVDREFGTRSVNDRVSYKQCEHCNLFARQHSAWHLAMHGKGWGRNRGKGYRQMCAMLERFGTREAWQDAYLDDFREARDARAVHRAWVDRNRTPFDDHMEITVEGYAKRPDLKAERRIAREQKRIGKQRKRIDEFVARAVDALVEGLPMPSAGDCFGCQFRTGDPSVEPMGDDHLSQHIDEDYFVPSMYANAFLARGMQPVGAYMMLNMNQDTGRMGGERIDRKEVGRVLRRYLYSKLVREHAVR
jgi:hypothetical protein